MIRINGGSLRRVLLLITIVTLASLAGTTQTAFIVLNPLNWQPGHLPDGWQVKVNYGMPKIATVREGNTNYLDLKSRDSSYIGAEFLFQVISERAERAAIIVTTNLPF